MQPPLAALRRRTFFTQSSHRRLAQAYRDDAHTTKTDTEHSRCQNTVIKLHSREGRGASRTSSRPKPQHVHAPSRKVFTPRSSNIDGFTAVSSTDITCLLNVVLFQGLRRAVYGVLLHVLGHVGILDDSFPFRHPAAVLRQFVADNVGGREKRLDSISAAASFVHSAAAETKLLPRPPIDLRTPHSPFSL